MLKRNAKRGAAMADRLPEWLRNVLKNRKAAWGLGILVFFLLVAVFADVIAPVDPLLGPNKMVARPKMAPSLEHPLGTTLQGQEVLTLLVHGTRRSMGTAFITGTITVFIAILMGISAGFLGGLADEAISLVTNIFLVIPSLPLMIVIAGWMDSKNPFTMIFVLAITGWAVGSRVLRSQALTLRNSEFVAAARVVGETNGFIIFREILPNIYSLVVSLYINAVTFVILTMSSLEFLGLGNPTAVSWGSMLYWAQNSQALLQGAWWTFVPAGVCIAMVGLSLTLLNYGIDELTNPVLKTD